MVDVEVGVDGEAFHDQVDEPLEGPPLPAGGDGPALGGPEGVERGPARFIGAAGFYDAEEVLDSVHLVRAEEGVALDIEEQVPLQRFGQHQQAVIGDQGPVPVPGRYQPLREHLAGLLALHLDPGLGMDSLQRLPPDPLRSPVHGLEGLGKP